MREPVSRDTSLGQVNKPQRQAGDSKSRDFKYNGSGEHHEHQYWFVCIYVIAGRPDQHPYTLSTLLATVGRKGGNPNNLHVVLPSETTQRVLSGAKSSGIAERRLTMCI